MKLVILCGGSGTRLWPISRTSSPKQFAKIINGKSLFELTIERNLELCDGIIVVVNKEQLDLCKQQVPKMLKDKTSYIIEPTARNTAPAITLAALHAIEDDLLVVPSDHLIKEMDVYAKCVRRAHEISQKKKLVTFGLTPTYPETGFGYIEADKETVISFKEKPDLETATKYLKKGNYLWNSGMFYLNSRLYLEELQIHSPETFKATKVAMSQSYQKENEVHINLENMNSIPKESIDYAVMEKSKSVAVVAANFYWTDLGSFDALDEVLPKDKSQNTQSDKHISYNSKNNFILSEKRIIATFDVSDLIIVETEDAILVGKKGNSQNVKEIFKEIEKRAPHLTK